MTFENIKKRVASNIGYVDSSGDFLTGKDITETDIGNWVNDRYRNDLVPALMEQYPEDFEQTSKANFYKNDSTISSISDTTLNASGAIFNTGMVGDRIYNSDDESYQTIASYTDTDTIELDSAMSDWEATDTIYVLGHEFAIGGDATDLRLIREVAVKYDSDSDYYTVCKQRDQNQLFQTGNESYSQRAPVWYVTTTKVDSDPTTTLGILPEPEESTSNGIRVRYTELPTAMSDDADTPRLPLGSHTTLVKGATADCLRKMRKFDVAAVFEQDFYREKQQMITTYALNRTQGAVKAHPSRKLKNMLERTI